MNTLIWTMTPTVLAMHLRSLKTDFNPFYTASLLKNRFVPILKKITDMEYGWIFGKVRSLSSFEPSSSISES